MTDLDDPTMWTALSQELDGTFGLLRAGDRMLDGFGTVTLDSDPLLACLAPGVERLLKVVHGLAVLDESGQWPSKDEMSKRLRHRISGLDQLCRGHTRTRIARATHPAYVRGLLDDVDRNATTTELMEVLTHYASSGRFHNLDTLADGPPQEPSPRQLWEALEMRLLKQRPDLLADLGKPAGFDQARTWLNQQCREALRDWQLLYVRAGMHGCFGDRGRRWLSGYLPAA